MSESSSFYLREKTEAAENAGDELIPLLGFNSKIELIEIIKLFYLKSLHFYPKTSLAFFSLFWKMSYIQVDEKPFPFEMSI